MIGGAQRLLTGLAPLDAALWRPAAPRVARAAGGGTALVAALLEIRGPVEIALRSDGWATVALHLDGAAVGVSTDGGGRFAARLAPGAVSVTPAGAAAAWALEDPGPAQALHLHIAASRLEATAAELGRAGARLRPELGASAPRLRAVAAAVLAELDAPTGPGAWAALERLLAVALLDRAEPAERRGVGMPSRVARCGG